MDPRDLSGEAVMLRRTFDAQQAAHSRDPMPDRAARVRRLAALEDLVRSHLDELAAAIRTDFGHRSVHETRLLEGFPSLEALRDARRHVGRWMKPQRRATSLWFLPGRSEVRFQPLGVVGVIVPWNYPLYLAVGPLAGALAAGNRAMVKLSEFTPAFADLFGRLVRERFAEDELAVVTGDASVAAAFSALPFDHLFFTGSTAVGRLVAQAAAKNLTPVTLELGGKSPAIVDASADLDRIAPVLAIGKLFNAGQTCIAPDYALVPRSRVDEFAKALVRAVAKLYPTLAANRDYTSIVDERHYARLQRLLADAKARGARIVEINPAGETLDPARRKIAPTLVVGAGDEAAIMREEIFGPLLPLVAYDHLDDAIRYVNQHDRPLALYWFGANAGHRDRVLHRTIAGGVTVNGCLTHFAQEHQPFGGVGASGSGAYHGEYGFRTFSKEKPVYYQSRLGLLPMLLPPYGRRLDAVLAWFKRGGKR